MYQIQAYIHAYSTGREIYITGTIFIGADKMKIYIIKLKTIVVFAIITIALIVLAAARGLLEQMCSKYFPKARDSHIFS